MMFIEQVRSFSPSNEQEENDRRVLLQWLESGSDVYNRTNLAAHLTASSWVVSPDRTQVLMIYHNLYDSWAWMGGHADGEQDLYAVALRETQEESGIGSLKPLQNGIFSLEILTVDGHIKRGAYVPSHLHLNVTYLFEADPNEPVRIKPDENSGVRWICVDELSQFVSEPWMMKWIYSKLTKKVLSAGT